MKKVVRNILIGLYIIITIVVTYCLLSYNKYNVSEFKDKTLLILKDKTYNYHKSDLLVVKKSTKYRKGDAVIYYDLQNSPVEVKINKIVNVEPVGDGIYTYTLDNEEKYNDDNFIGTTKTTSAYSVLGTIYSLLTSKWGYLIIIIFPMLVAFIYEIYQIIREIKK